MALEEEFGLDIPDEDADKLKTVGDAMNYLQQHAGK
jgi:acyl carrier protein